MTYFNSPLKVAKLSLIAALSLGMSACATSGANVVPIIDAPDSPQLQADLAQCQSLAAQYNGEGNDALAAAIVGAGLGALTGSSFGGRPFSNRGRGENALAGALAGAAAGTGVGIYKAQGKQADIVYRCMAGRGYNILG